MSAMLHELSTEQRAVRDAELALDRAESALLSKRSDWAARTRYRAAQHALDIAVARREKRRADLAGVPHLTIVNRTTQS